MLSSVDSCRRNPAWLLEKKWLESRKPTSRLLTTRSNRRAMVLVMEMRRYAEGSERSPFLKMAKALAFFHSAGMTEWNHEKLKMEVMAACREGEPLERNVAEMESGPGAVE